MPSPNELRVFISSTFRDLQEEREHLVKKIFPEIRSLCRERGITFTEVDLRWGLTEEDQVLGQIIRTCLEEIDRCRPYFIGITGSSYGYLPKLTEIYKDPELLRSYTWVEDAVADGMSLLEMEFRYGAFSKSEGRRVKGEMEKGDEGRVRGEMEKGEGGKGESGHGVPLRRSPESFGPWSPLPRVGEEPKNRRTEEPPGR